MKNNKTKGWVFFLLSVLLIVMLIYFTGGSNLGKEINISGSSSFSGVETLEELIGDGTKESEIKYIVFGSDGVGYVLRKDSKYTVDGITENCDYHFTFLFETDIETIEGFIKSYEAARTGKVEGIEGNTEWTTISTNRIMIGGYDGNHLLHILA